MHLHRICTLFAASLTLHGGILSVSSGDAVQGNPGSNFILNGSFESRGGSIPAAPSSVCVSGVSGTRESTCGSTPTYSIPDWTVSGSDGSYAEWGNILGRRTVAPPDGNMMVYFGNWFTGATSTFTIDADGIVTFASAPTFTNFSNDITGPVTVSQTVNGLDTTQSYLLDFWTNGEGNTSSFPRLGVFGLDITGENTIYLAAPATGSTIGLSQRYYVLFQPTASTVTLTWSNWGHINTPTGSGTELILDDVILSPVPEPATGILCAAAMLLVAVRRVRG